MYNSYMKFKATVGILIIVTLIGSFYLGQRYVQNESLNNTQWLLLEGEGLDLAATNVQITLNFEPSKRIAGYSGVNQFGGTYLLKSNNQIEFSEIYSTLMASMDPLLNENERQYLSLLIQSKKYQLSRNELVFLDGNNDILLIFKPKN